MIVDRGSGSTAGGTGTSQPIVGGIALSAEELDARIRAIVNQVHTVYTCSAALLLVKYKGHCKST